MTMIRGMFGVMTMAAVAALTVAGEQDMTASTPGTITLYSVEAGRMIETSRVDHSEAQWKELLTPEQFRIARQQGTERAFTGRWWDNHVEGVYRCAACGTDLFVSTTKFESGTGWPSFYEPVNPANIGTTTDRTLLWQQRTEVHCARCGAHLGHVFDDGPQPTGLRYCLNGNVLDFVPLDLDHDGVMSR